MDQNTENNISQPDPAGENPLQTAPEAHEDIPVSDAMTGVITEPGDTYEAVKASTKRNYWVVPTIILIIISIAASYLITHDDELYSEIKSTQLQSMRENWEKDVKEGKLSAEEYNQRMESVEKGMDPSNPIVMVFTIVGPVFSILMLLFFLSLIFWLIFRALKGTASYMLIVCVLGLASLITAFQSVINTVLAILMGNIRANAGLGLLFSAESVGESLYKFLSHFDLFTIWYLIVVSIGIARVSSLKSSKTMPVIFGLWLIWILFSSFVKIPFFG